MQKCMMRLSQKNLKWRKKLIIQELRKHGIYSIYTLPTREFEYRSHQQIFRNKSRGIL